jgi:hypothetical protein
VKRDKRGTYKRNISCKAVNATMSVVGYESENPGLSITGHNKRVTAPGSDPGAVTQAII